MINPTIDCFKLKLSLEIIFGNVLAKNGIKKNQNNNKVKIFQPSVNEHKIKAMKAPSGTIRVCLKLLIIFVFIIHYFSTPTIYNYLFEISNLS